MAIGETDRKRSLLASLDASPLEAPSTSYRARQPLLRQGDPAESVFFVTAGVVALGKQLPDGRRQIVGFSGAGDMVGHWSLDENPYSAYALVDVTARKVRRKDLLGMSSNHEDLLIQLRRATDLDLVHAQDHITTLGRGRAEEKLAWFLLRWRNKWRQDERSDRVPLPMSRGEIADYLGLSLETVSRTFSWFARKGLLTLTPEGVEMCDPQTIERLAQYEPCDVRAGIGGDTRG